MNADLNTIDKWTSSLETQLAVKDSKTQYPKTESGGSIHVCTNFNSCCPEKMALAQLNCKIHSGKPEKVSVSLGDDIIDVNDIQNIYNLVTTRLMQYDKTTKYRTLNDYVTDTVSIEDPIKFLNDKMIEITKNMSLYPINVNTYKNKKIIARKDLYAFINNAETFLNDCLCYTDCISYSICHCYGNCNYY